MILVLLAVERLENANAAILMNAPSPVSPEAWSLFVVHLLSVLLGCSGQMRIANRCGIVFQSAQRLVRASTHDGCSYLSF